MSKVAIISLGCPRNLVDSEVMLGCLKEKGYDITGITDGPDVAIVNTCSFIREAADESIDTILGVIELKRKKKIKRVVVAGCLAQRYKEKLRDELGEVDGFVGTGDVIEIDAVVSGVLKKRKISRIAAKPDFVHDHTHKREIISPPHSVYLKIQEGCANDCSYCVIPGIRGGLRSRPMESILKELEHLTDDHPAAEINVIGQDTTSYGVDLYREPRIAVLLKRIADMGKARWIRLLYTHPAHYTDELVSTIADTPSICRYIDLPIQHISGRVLRRMNRGVTPASILSLIKKLRGAISGLAIRSTVIVGFPGETEDDFNELLDFLSEIKFERLGAFRYSNEEGAASFGFPGQIPDEVKDERLDRVMSLQRAISAEKNRELLGRALDVLIDEANPEDERSYLGRTEYDAPSVDGQVYVSGWDLRSGDMVRVKITDTLEYDLVGEAE